MPADQPVPRRRAVEPPVQVVRTAGSRRLSRRQLLGSAGWLGIATLGGIASPGCVTGSDPSPAPASLGPTDLRARFHKSVVSGTRLVHVEGRGGSDSNDGSTPDTAFRTIQHAVDVARPGDRILVGVGTYPHLDIYGYRGDAEHWLSLEGAPGPVRPIIDVADDRGRDGIDVQQSSHVGIYGFELRGKQLASDPIPSGIAVFRGSDHIFLWDNLIHDFSGGGINNFFSPSTVYDGRTLPSGGWDLVDVSFNVIYRTSKYNPTNTSGISFYGAVDTTGTTLGGFGYRAVGNRVFDVICLVDSVSGEGTFPFVTDGNGISVDSLFDPYQPGLQPYTKQGLLEYNVVAGNGGRGIYVFKSVNVLGRFNTAVGNLRSRSPAIAGGVELDSTVRDGNVLFYGNIILPLNTDNTTDHRSRYSENVIAGGTQEVPPGNLDRRKSGARYLVGNPTRLSVMDDRPLSFYAPRHPDRVPNPRRSGGFHALDPDLTRPGSPVPAGALGA